MIVLTDDQQRAVLAAMRPLAPRDRDAFLADVTAALAGRMLGDGLVHRIVAEAQRRHLVPPNLDRAKGEPRHERKLRAGES
jgi:hypothetical protein